VLPWAGQRGRTGRQRVAWSLGANTVACGWAAGGLVLSENLRAVRRTLNPERDLDAPAMLKMRVRHASRTGTVFASCPDLTLFRSGALAVKGLERVVEKRRVCSDLSPASAIAILQKTPADAVWTQSLTDTEASIYRPFASTNYWERHYVKALKNSAGYL
jgi:hypothetical protein